jgi:hypothetical protein
METIDPKSYLQYNDVKITYSGTYWETASKLPNLMNPDTSADGSWNSGNYAVQWIQFDLKVARILRTAQLHVDISPDCDVTYKIELNKGLDSYSILTERTEYHQSGGIIEIPIESRVANVRITTLKSQSWIAWKRVLFTVDPEEQLEVDDNETDEPEITYSGLYNGSTLPDLMTRNILVEGGWNSGGYATQWVQLDFNRTRHVKAIELIVDISPDCDVEYKIEINNGVEDDQDEGLKTIEKKFSESHKAGQMILHWLEAKVKRIRIMTTKSESWVAWKRVFLLEDDNSRKVSKLAKPAKQINQEV